MPLYERQHLVEALGYNYDGARDALHEQLDALPVVRIIQLTSSTFPMTILGQSLDGVRLIAVVEEVQRTSQEHALTLKSGLGLTDATSPPAQTAVPSNHCRLITKWSHGVQSRRNWEDALAEDGYPTLERTRNGGPIEAKIR